MKSKTILRHLAIFAILFCLFSFNTNPVSASHNAGGAISYTHISGNLYKVRVAYYRNCLGTPVPGFLNLRVISLSCNIDLTYTMSPIPGTGLEIVLTCPGILTTCNGGSITGFQKHEYEVDISLPGQCPDWIFSYNDCCRNGSITTLQSAASADTYIEARLNNLNGDNNSPQFTNDPLIFACLDQDLHYNNGMFDADGDSLVYQLISARSGPNANILYYPSHSAWQPLISIPPVTFDFFTGDLFIHPTAQEVGVVVYEVKDYRNGELKGSVMRDVMMYTIPCSNQNPTATHMNGTSQQIAYVFPNDTICFDIFSDDTDVLDSLTMTWNQVIPAATFTTTGAPHPTGNFCWIPLLNDVRSNPYMFTAMIRDNFCPLNNAGVYSYYIYVTLDSSLVFLSANDFFEDSPLLVSPNPSQGIFTIQSARQFSRLKIYNSLGECVFKKEFENRIDLSDQPGGIYFVEAITNEGKAMRLKFVKN